MKQLNKRILAVLLAVVLAFGSLPLPASSAENTDTVSALTDLLKASISGEPTVPETTEATVPETTEATVPETTEATVPETTEATVPETTEATVPETTEATVPETTEATVPETTEATVPETTEATEPQQGSALLDALLEQVDKITETQTQSDDLANSIASAYQANVGRKAVFNDYYSSFPISADPAAETDGPFHTSVTNISYDDVADLVVKIADVYDDGTYYWYKLEAAEGTLPDSLAAEPWVYQNTSGEQYDSDSLILQEEEEEEENVTVKDDTTGITVEGVPTGSKIKVSAPMAGVYDIKILNPDGTEWQPIDEGKTVRVSIPVTDIADGGYVDVWHFIDYATDINGDEVVLSTEEFSDELLALMQPAIDAYGDGVHVAVDFGYQVQVIGGMATIDTGSFSVFYYNGSEYGNSDGNNGNYINFESGNVDNGKNYFVTRGTEIYATRGLSAGWDWSYPNVFGMEKVGYTEQNVIFTVSDEAEIYGRYDISLEGWLSSTTIHFIVMPELTLHFTHNLTGIDVTLPADITNIFMGNCKATEHDPDNNKYGALNYTLPVPENPTGYEFVQWYVAHEPSKTFAGGTQISLSNSTLEVNMIDTVDEYEVTLVADYDPIEYTITYNPNGGTMPDGESTTREYTIADTVHMLVPTYSGYNFNGWTVTATDGEAENWPDSVSAGSSVTGCYGNVTLTANWVAAGNISYKVKHYFQNVAQTGYVEDAVADTMYGTTGETTQAQLVQRSVSGFTVKEIGSAIIVGDGSTEVAIYYDRKTVTINFESNGGTEIAAISGVYGAVVSAPTEPSKANYIFMGWYTAANPNNYYTFSTFPADDLTLYAKWNVMKAVVNFLDPDNGSLLYRVNQDAETYVDLDAIPEPSATGKVFDGWNDEDGKLNQPLQAGEITIYAKWKYISYKITYAEWDGTDEIAVPEITENPLEFTVKDTLPDSLPSPNRTGYTFGGWYSDKLCEGISYTAEALAQEMLANTRYDENLTVAKILYAKWTVLTYTITFDTDGGSKIDPITQNYGTKVDAPADPTKTGYTFKGWDQEIPETMPAEDMTITAEWVIEEYKINYVNVDDRDFPDPPGKIGKYTIEDDVTLTNPARDDRTFAGWTGEDLTEKTLTVQFASGDKTGDLEYTAHWKCDVTVKSTLTECTVKFNDEPVSTAEWTKTVEYNSNAVLTVTPASGYRIESVKIDGTVDDSATASAKSEGKIELNDIQKHTTVEIVTAPITLTVTLTGDSVGSGVYAVMDANGSELLTLVLAPGESVTVVQVPVDSYVIAKGGWDWAYTSSVPDTKVTADGATVEITRSATGSCWLHGGS